MKNDVFITLSQAAKFMGVSRPTMNKFRMQYSISEKKKGRSVYLNKAELLKVYAQENNFYSTQSLLITENDAVENFKVDANTFDLRKISRIDAYGSMSLLIACVNLLEKRVPLFLIVSDTVSISTLCLIGFFKELDRRFNGQYFLNVDDLPKNPETKGYSAFLPFKYIAFGGQETQLLASLAPLLQKQEYDSDIAGYIGWMMGEVADNSLTHAKGPCYVLMGQFSKENKFLQIAVGDTGKGIFNSLKENPKYSSLLDEVAFIKAFQSTVSCWPDTKPRGKGLCDVLSLAMRSHSILRVDSQNLGLLFNFTHHQKELQIRNPASQTGGSRLCWLLINNQFGPIERQDVDNFILKEIERRK